MDEMSERQVRGTLAEVSESSVAAALARVSRGKIYSLESRWWRGMPGHPVHRVRDPADQIGDRRRGGMVCTALG